MLRMPLCLLAFMLRSRESKVIGLLKGGEQLVNHNSFISKQRCRLGNLNKLPVWKQENKMRNKWQRGSSPRPVKGLLGRSAENPNTTHHSNTRNQQKICVPLSFAWTSNNVQLPLCHVCELLESHAYNKWWTLCLMTYLFYEVLQTRSHTTHHPNITNLVSHAVDLRPDSDSINESL